MGKAKKTHVNTVLNIGQKSKEINQSRKEKGKSEGKKCAVPLGIKKTEKQTSRSLDTDVKRENNIDVKGEGGKRENRRSKR